MESMRLAPFQPRGTDVAVILDLMIHDLDLVLHLLGGVPASEVRASGVAVLSPHLDMANARVEFANGAVANVTASRMARERVRKLRLFQPSGYLTLDLAAGSGRIHASPPGMAAGPVGETGRRGRADSAARRPKRTPSGWSWRASSPPFWGWTQSGVTGEEGRAALALALQVIEAVNRSPISLPHRA